MGKRTVLYLICLVMFPLAFVGFVIGFGTPAWIGSSNFNTGLWQTCLDSITQNCTTFDFDAGGDWMIGVRAVEIFAMVMLFVAAVDIVYENCTSSFYLRPLSERIAAGLLCVLGGLGGLAGVILYVVKTNDIITNGVTYSWSMPLVAAGSGMAVVLGVGFLVSGIFLEPSKKSKSSGMNGHGPYLTSNDENYELSAYTNKAMRDDRGAMAPSLHNNNDNGHLPGIAMYNGVLNRSGYRNSMSAVEPSTVNVLPPFTTGGRGGGGGMGPPPVQPKHSQYYSISDDRMLDPGFDLSEGYLPSRSRQQASRPQQYARSEDPYSRGATPRNEDPYNRLGAAPRAEDPYYRGSPNREEDPYSRVPRREGFGGPPRAGYNDPYGFDRRAEPDLRQSRGGGGGGGGGGGVGRSDPYNQVPRDSFYRPGRF